jgi:hypothetical protein
MKSKMLVIAALFAFVVSAHAASKNVTLLSDTSVNGTTLKPGDYKVSVEGSSVSFAQGKKVLATAPGKFVDADTKASRDAVVTRSGKLVRIEFGGKKQQIVLDEGSGSMAGSN